MKINLTILLLNLFIPSLYNNLQCKSIEMHKLKKLYPIKLIRNQKNHLSTKSEVIINVSKNPNPYKEIEMINKFKEDPGFLTIKNCYLVNSKNNIPKLMISVLKKDYDGLCLEDSLIHNNDIIKEKFGNDFIKKPILYKKSLFWKWDIMFKMANSVKRMHNLNILNLGMDENNILLKDNFYPIIKNFSFAQEIPKNANHVELTNLFGSNGSFAPETILSFLESKGKNPILYDKTNDIFSLGTVFFYFLNPFIEQILLKNFGKGLYNIDIKKMFDDKILSQDYNLFAKLITGMTHEKKEKRFTIEKVILELENILKINKEMIKINFSIDPSNFKFAPHLYLIKELEYLKKKYFDEEFGKKNMEIFEKCNRGEKVNFIEFNKKTSKILRNFYRKLGVIERSIGIYEKLKNNTLVICFVKYMMDFDHHQTKLLI